jgi:hypothetical protein
MFLTAFIGPSKMGCIDYVYNPIHAAIYNAFAPIGWCALFIWMVITQHTGNSDCKRLKMRVDRRSAFRDSSPHDCFKALLEFSRRNKRNLAGIRSDRCGKLASLIGRTTAKRDF